MKLAYNQMDPYGKLLDPCLCWVVAHDINDLNNADSVPNAEMDSIRMGLDSENLADYNPDALSIEVAHLGFDIQIGKQGPCSGQRYQPARTGMCHDEYDPAVCYIENHYPAGLDICVDYEDKP